MKLFEKWSVLMIAIFMGLWLFPSQSFQAMQLAIDEIPHTKAALGERLFFDSILSSNLTVSCSSCHKPEFAFADNRAFSLGVNKTFTARNSPTTMYMMGRKALFWDGRATSLNEQALMPIADTCEMNLPIAIAIARLDKSPYYRKSFEQVFRARPTAHLLGEALASYQMSLGNYTSAFDRYRGGDENAMPARAITGLELFLGKAKCSLCHSGNVFTDDVFRNIGLNDLDLKNPAMVPSNDLGRFNVTKKKEDIGRFKTPHLRNVALTSPYMHDGSIKTIRKVIQFYNNRSRKIIHHWNLDTVLVQPLNLSKREEKDLEIFLEQLTDSELIKKDKKR